jgi:hypothetical protein
MTNKNNKISGNESKVVYMGKDVFDINDVYVYCIFKFVKSSSSRVSFNAITFLSNRVPNLTKLSAANKTVIVVSLFPQYFSHPYDVKDDGKIIFINLFKFISDINNVFTPNYHNLYNDQVLYIFHGFPWSQIIHMFKICRVDISGVKIPVKHTVNSLQIKLFSYLTLVFGSLEEAKKHLIEGTHFATFWGSAKLERPVYKTQSSNWEQFLAISKQFSFLISKYLKVKDIYFNCIFNNHKWEGINSEIEMLIKKKESLLSDKNSYIKPKAHISSLLNETSIVYNSLASEPKQKQQKVVRAKKQEKFKQHSNTPTSHVRGVREGAKDISYQSKDTPEVVMLQEIETNINKLTHEKESLSSVLYDLTVEHENNSGDFFSWLDNDYKYKIDSVLWELKSAIYNTIASIEEDFNRDRNTLYLLYQSRSRSRSRSRSSSTKEK